jgi:glycosyltransferase involved in cell wall biosynthesis
VAERKEVDLLLISTGTTPGHHRTEAETVAALRDLDVSFAQTKPDYRGIRWLHFALPLVDLSEAFAIRRATARACRTVRPRAFLYMSAVGALLEPESRLQRSGIRFDALARENRPGWRGLVQRPLERRAVRDAQVLIPMSLVAVKGREDLRLMPLQTPVSPSVGDTKPSADVVCYAGDPAKKGLDIMVAAWARLEPSGRRLLVAGIDGDRADRFLRTRGILAPASVEWLGALPPQRFRAMVRGAAAYLAASRYEDYGIAQLEALVDGTPLVTTPSAGPFDALGLLRGLAPDLIAEDGDAEDLAAALGRALDWTPERLADFRHGCTARMAEYSPDAMRRRLAAILGELGVGGGPGGEIAVDQG